HASRLLEQGGLPVWLDRALAAASIDDQRRDYRDWIMSLGDIYLSARAHGIDPAPAFKRVAEISNAEPHRAAPTPTRDAMSRFEKSAYFATSILPRLRRCRARRAASCSSSERWSACSGGSFRCSSGGTRASGRSQCSS